MTLISWGRVSQRRPGRLSRNRALQESRCWAPGLLLGWSLAGWRARWKNRLKKWSRRETFSTWQKALDKHELHVRITLRNSQLAYITLSATLGCIFNMEKRLIPRQHLQTKNKLNQYGTTVIVIEQLQVSETSVSSFWKLRFILFCSLWHTHINPEWSARIWVIHLGNLI